MRIVGFLLLAGMVAGCENPRSRYAAGSAYDLYLARLPDLNYWIPAEMKEPASADSHDMPLFVDFRTGTLFRSKTYAATRPARPEDIRKYAPIFVLYVDYDKQEAAHNAWMRSADCFVKSMISDFELVDPGTFDALIDDREERVHFSNARVAVEIHGSTERPPAEGDYLPADTFLVQAPDGGGWVPALMRGDQEADGSALFLDLRTNKEFRTSVYSKTRPATRADVREKSHLLTFMPKGDKKNSALLGWASPSSYFVGSDVTALGGMEKDFFKAAVGTSETEIHLSNARVSVP